MSPNAAHRPAEGGGERTTPVERATASVGSVGPAPAVSIAPAAGWWWLHRFTDLKFKRRTVRHRVAVWQLAVGPEWHEVRPMLAGDGAQLVYVEDLYGGEVDGFLEHDDELSHCVCGRQSWHDPDDADDLAWCCECAGVISVD